MAETKGAAGRGPGMNVDVKLVRELAEMLAETGLTEIEFEDGTRKVRVSRGGGVAMAAPIAMQSPAPLSPAAAPPPAPAAEAAGALKSPMVGTVYLTSEPGAEPFIRVGDKVSEGQTLVIIEAMKVMNAIPSPRSGTVRQVLVQDSQPVEYDQPLMIIE